MALTAKGKKLKRHRVPLKFFNDSRKYSGSTVTDRKIMRAFYQGKYSLQGYDVVYMVGEIADRNKKLANVYDKIAAGEL